MAPHNPIPQHFSLGVCFYPEQWPPGTWDGYARQIRELGLTYVRMAEFAWSRIEPAPRCFDWGWLDEAVAVLANTGLRVVPGTPTADLYLEGDLDRGQYQTRNHSNSLLLTTFACECRKGFSPTSNWWDRTAK